MIWLIVLEGRISQFFFTFSFSYFLTILGAIPELSADSCKEIKTSEGGQAVSGIYWLNFIKPHTPVLAHCDMISEGRVKQLNRRGIR